MLKRTTSNFANELLGLLATFGRCCSLPRVKAFHLPAAAAAGTKDGEFCAVELDDGSVGLSYVMLDDTLADLYGASGLYGVAGMPALEVAQAFGNAEGARRTLGFAAVNALSQCLFTRAGYEFDYDTDSMGQLQPGPGDHVGMIGHFTPLVPRIVEAGARLTVAELDPSFAGDFAGYRVTLDASELQSCNKVLSTSTVLLNDTLDDVLAQCKAAQWFAMVGPNAGCLPDPLFARGVGTVGSTHVVDRNAFVAALTSGRRWGDYVRKYAISRDSYPGFDGLLARLRSQGG
jgi:uncharacterized protein (DUF4213/DUF364 family)